MKALRSTCRLGRDGLLLQRNPAPKTLRTTRKHSASAFNHQKTFLIGYSATGLLAGIVGAATSLEYCSQDGQNSLSQKGDSQVQSAHRYPKYADKLTMLKAVKEIQAELGDDAVSVDEDDIESHGYSEWSTSNSPMRPVAVISPTCTKDVSFITKICTKYKIPMIAYGAGSSVEGNVSAPFSGFSIDLSKMNKIVEFHSNDLDIVVEPGVNWVELNERIKSSGLFLPLDPSPTALIGGMVATNCSGTNAMRYGTMKDWVVNLTVVLADGSVIQTRRRPRKTSAGYNLNGLFTGSEGTLGIITQITLKLAVIPSHFGVATTTFPTIKDAAGAATTMVRTGIPLAALELMDDTQMTVINRTGGVGGKMLPEKPTLFLRFSGSERAVQESMSQVKYICRGHGSNSFQVATSEEEMNNLWLARKQALWAMLAIRPEGTQIWSTDVAVPMSRLVEIMDYSKNNASQLGLFSSLLGHVGDGNFHQVVMYNPDDDGQVAAVRECLDDMVANALAMEGTVSGEHGIGLGKKDCLAKELGAATINVMKSLKRALDPHWLLNPGKIFDF
jgi:D-lactate dehydrogenase (cytochrome)